MEFILFIICLKDKNTYFWNKNTYLFAMKKLFLFICLLAFCQLFSQKKYYFDYGLQYEETIIKSNKVKTNIYLVNSKQNNYFLSIEEKDSINNDLRLIDQNGVTVIAKINKKDFLKAETITNNCDQTFRFSSLGKEKVKDYSFTNLKDTIINDTSYYHYMIKCNKSLKYQKKKKIATAHFIIDKSSPNFVPFLYQSIMYEVGKINRNIPNGYPKLIYFINCDGTKDSELKLMKSLKIEKYLTIPNECDYTIEEIRNKPPFTFSSN